MSDLPLPRVFVGSSVEAAAIDREIRPILERLGALVVPWQTIFRVSEFGIESLMRETSGVDGALLIASQDDKTWYRGVEQMSPRDNIIFEFGLFAGALGRHRVALVEATGPGQARPALPSDLNGLTTIRFSPSRLSTCEAELSSWLVRVKDDANSSVNNLDAFIETLGRLKKVDPDWIPDIQRFLDRELKQPLSDALRGKIRLTPAEYYRMLNKEMDSTAKGVVVSAVSTLSSLIWSENEHQRRYLQKNLDAVRRGVRIRRLFLLPKDHDLKLKQVVERQSHAEIEIRLAAPKKSPEIRMLNDIVVFEDHTRNRVRAYIADPARDDPSAIRGGHLILDSDRCQSEIRIFKAAWAVSDDLSLLLGMPERSKFPEAPNATRERHEPEPPGEGMSVRYTGKPVTTCEEAAQERGVPLTKELKTLIIETSLGLLAVHLRGDRRLSLRRVKDLLGVEEAHLASPEKLSDLGLSPGTVSAVHNPVWSLPHLVSQSLMQIDEVTTNNKTLMGYLSFDPRVLLKSRRSLVASLEEEDSSRFVNPSATRVRASELLFGFRP